MLRPIGAIAALLLSTQSAFAFVYDCSITGPSKWGWMGDNIIFSVDEDAKTVAVVDVMILSVQEVPVITKLETEYGRQVMRWKLRGMKGSSDNGPALDIGTVSYKATIFPNNKFSLQAYLHGPYENLPRGDGFCVKKEK